MKFREYFTPYEDYFWALQEEGGTSVFVLPSGRTIVYSQLLMLMLQDLADQGLPPLGALLLAVVATNHSIEDELQMIEEEMRKVIAGFRPEESNVANESLDEAIDLLRTLAALPLKYTSGNQRIQLFQLLFANSHNQITPHQSREILLHTRSCVDEQGKISGLPTAKKITWAGFSKDFRTISLLGRRFPSVDAIIGQLAAMPPLSEALSLEETPEPRTGDLIEELIGHPLTFQVGTLIKPIWSGLNIPMHHQLPGDQPLGGFSDLSNKGDFDKLLISEFANDELLLLSRLANNEALFLHREIPPGTDDLQRVVLLDVSLKSWGSPRILAFATMLAIARHPRTDIHSTVFAVGSEFHPVAFGNVDEVIASLQLLEGCLHPAEGLSKFFDRQPARARLEIIFIAPPDTLAQPSVKKVISDHYSAFKYWIEVGREGEIAVYKNQNNSRKLIQQMRLSLDSIWKSYKQVPADVRTDNVAAALSPRKARAPLLYPAGPFKFCMTAEDKEVYCIDRQGKLFRLYRDKGDKESGFELLFEGLPPAATHFAIGKVEKRGHRLLLCYTAGTGEMLQFDVETGEVTAIDLHGNKGGMVGEIFFSKGVFYYQSPKDYTKIINGTAIHYANLDLVGRVKYENGLKEDRSRLAEAIQLLRRNKFPILRNLATVGINKTGNLVFNKHELVCRPAGHIVLTQRGKDREPVDVVCYATWDEGSGAFVFESGNRVRGDRSGMLILEWREQASASKDVLMTGSGANKLSVVKEIKEQANVSLVDAKKMVDADRATVVSGVTMDDAVRLRDRLMNQGAVAEVIPTPQIIYIPAALDTSLGVATASEFAGNSYYHRHVEDGPMRIIDPNKFFKKNIRSFVQDVLQWSSR